jgi:hypothetical protein
MLDLLYKESREIELILTLLTRPSAVNKRYHPEVADRVLSSQAMVPNSGDTRNSDSRPVGNIGIIDKRVSV